MAFLPMLEKRAGPLFDIFADGVARLAESKRNFWEGFRERGGTEGLAGVYVKPFFICGFFWRIRKKRFLCVGKTILPGGLYAQQGKLSYPKTKKKKSN